MLNKIGVLTGFQKGDIIVITTQTENPVDNINVTGFDVVRDGKELLPTQDKLVENLSFSLGVTLIDLLMFIKEFVNLDTVPVECPIKGSKHLSFKLIEIGYH